MITTSDQSVQSRYVWVSGLLFASAIASIHISSLLLSIHSTFFNAIGILIFPFALFCWIFTTVRALHLRSVRYWGLASTYVNLIVTILFAGVLIFYIGAHEDTLHMFIGSTSYWVIIIMYGVMQLWSLGYNLCKTNSIILAVMVTIMQSMGGIAIVALILYHNPRRNDEPHDT